jgi:hypothetical protein
LAANRNAECELSSRLINIRTVALAPMIWRLLRGVFSVMAVAAGLLLAYGIAYAMEGMTTRIPKTSINELATTTIWMLPWMFLYCSGLEDFVTVTGQAFVFWLGLAPALAFLYYFERHMSSGLLTKTAMPLLAIVGGVLPHVFRRLIFVFAILPFVAGIAALVVLYYTFPSLLRFSFATRTIGFLIVLFEAACLGSCALSAAFLRADVASGR